MPTQAHHEATIDEADGPQVVVLHTDANHGLERSLSSSISVRVALIRLRDIHHDAQYDVEAINSRIEAIRTAKPSTQTPHEGPTFLPIGPDSIDGDTTIRLAPGQVGRHGFDNLLIVPMVEGPFHLSMSFRQRRQWEVARGHHGQCHQYERSQVEIGDGRPTIGSMVPVAALR